MLSCLSVFEKLTNFNVIQATLILPCDKKFQFKGVSLIIFTRVKLIGCLVKEQSQIIGFLRKTARVSWK